MAKAGREQRRVVFDLTAVGRGPYTPGAARLAACNNRTIESVVANRLRDERGRPYSGTPPLFPARVLVEQDTPPRPYGEEGAHLLMMLWAVYFTEQPALWLDLGKPDAIRDETGTYEVGALPERLAPNNSAQAIAALVAGRPLPPPYGGIYARLTDGKTLPPARALSGRALDGPRCDAILGACAPPAQYGILGRSGTAPRELTIGLDLGGTNIISVFGGMGAGKSTTLANILETALMPVAGLNRLPAPLAGVAFHYTSDKGSKPEYATMIDPATGPDADLLRRAYRVEPRGLPDCVILAPSGELDRRRHEFPRHRVEPILFHPGELDFAAWKLFMNAPGERVYMREIQDLMSTTLRGRVTVDALRHAVAASETLSKMQISQALARIRLADKYVQPGVTPLHRHLAPGRLVIVDLRDEYLDKHEALTLILVMYRIFAARRPRQDFNRIILLDEAHQYFTAQSGSAAVALAHTVTETVREMRHRGITLAIGSQEPGDVPIRVIELSTQLYLHRFSSPGHLRHLQRANGALRGFRPEDFAALKPGEACAWSLEAMASYAANTLFRLTFRPRLTRAGGATRRVGDHGDHTAPVGV